VDIERFVQQQGFDDVPIGIGGCRALGPGPFEPCATDLLVFDERSREPETVAEYDDETIIIRHASLAESDPGRLLQYDGLEVLRDDSWNLKMLLLRIEKKRDSLYGSLAKNSLIQAIFCCQKVIESVERPSVFAPCWQKCASLYLADAICALNRCRTSPSHMLEALRNLPKSTINEYLTVVTDTVGIERATPTLLARMAKSTAGFSDTANGREDYYSRLISEKRDFFVDKSMYADCYFYLAYVNKENLTRISETLHKKPELIHMLKVAFDVEMETSLLLQYVKPIKQACGELLGYMSL